MTQGSEKRNCRRADKRAATGQSATVRNDFNDSDLDPHREHGICNGMCIRTSEEIIRTETREEHKIAEVARDLSGISPGLEYSCFLF